MAGGLEHWGWPMQAACRLVYTLRSKCHQESIVQHEV